VEAHDDVSVTVSTSGVVPVESVGAEGSLAKCPSFSGGVVAFAEVEATDVLV
jgi:hypothetical protein